MFKIARLPAPLVGCSVLLGGGAALHVGYERPRASSSKNPSDEMYSTSPEGDARMNGTACMFSGVMTANLSVAAAKICMTLITPANCS